MKCVCVCVCVFVFVYHKVVGGAMETGRDKGVTGRGWCVSRDDETMGPEGSNYERINLRGRGRGKGGRRGHIRRKATERPCDIF